MLNHCVLPFSFYETHKTLLFRLFKGFITETMREKVFYMERNEVWGVGVLQKNSFITPGRSEWGF